MIPEKLNNGDPFKYNVARAINQIIDCLRENQITSIIGGTFRRSPGGTSIIITKNNTAAAHNSSGEALYIGQLAIVKQNDVYMVGDNSGDVLLPCEISVNGKIYSIPVTIVEPGKNIYLKVDMSGETFTCSIVQQYAAADNVYYFFIGTITDNGAITQSYKGGDLNVSRPVSIDRSLSDFIYIGSDNALKIQPMISSDALLVPVISGGKVTLVEPQELPEEAYGE